MHEHEEYHIAVLHQTLASPELEEACRFIRHQWPHAGILVVRTGEDFLEDALYDDRVIPDVAEEVLLATIKQLTSRWSGGRHGNGRL
jgi:hypothetical protein